MNNLMIELFHLFAELFHHKTNRFLKCRKSKVILNYWQYLKINRQGILVKQINTTEQIVLPQKYRYVVYKELHENMGHLGPERVIEICRKRFYWPGYEKDITHYVRKM